MTSRNRRQELRLELETKRKVNINELAEKFAVSSMTIRRDLQRLSDMGIVTLVPSGAVYNEGGANLQSVAAREKNEPKEKGKIAKACADMVKEGSAVFLDAGSTCMAIAENLATRRNIAVITHSLPVMNILSVAEGIQLFSLAGIFDSLTKAFMGDLAIRNLRGFRIDIAFIGTCGLSITQGVTSNNASDHGMKRAIVETARRKIATADHTKLGTETFLKVADLREIDTIVTGKQADKEFINGAKRLGVEIILAD